MRIWVAIAAMSVVGLAVLAAQPPARKSPPPTPPTPQQTRPAAEQPDETNPIVVNVTRVDMLFTVTDKKGKFVTDLTRNDFEVFENKKPQVIQEFNSESDLPLRLAVLIDTSNSIRDRFKFEQEAASEFLNSVVHPRQDKAMVVSFDTAPELRADLIDDTEKLDQTIHDLRPGGGTALYDAIYFACRDKLQQDQPRSNFRHAIVILSDGDDNQSRYTRDQALEMAQKADVVIYAISTNYSRIESDGDKVLKYFTAETGGRAFFPFKVDDLQQDFVDIYNELRHQYNIAYSPQPLMTDGLFHPIEVHVKGRKELIVHARKGYYARKM